MVLLFLKKTINACKGKFGFNVNNPDLFDNGMDEAVGTTINFYSSFI